MRDFLKNRAGGVEMERIEGLPKSYLSYPMVAAVVGVKEASKINFIPVVWHVQLSFDPPLYGVAISPKRFSHDMILKAGEFSVNFLPFEHAELIAKLGSTSGRDVDKVKEFDIKLRDPVKLDVPIIDGVYAAFECELIEHSAFGGDHTFFVGEVVATHFDPNVFDEKLTLEPQKVLPTLYLGKYKFLTVDPKSLRIIKG